MNIVYCLHNFPKLSQSFILNEIYELERRGHSLTIISTKSSRDGIFHEEFNQLDADIHFLDISPRDSYKAFHPGIISKNTLRYMERGVGVKYLLASLVIGREGIKILNREAVDPDIIHSHFATTQAMGARYIADYFNVPASLTTHAGGLYAHDNNSRRDWILSSMDGLMTVSNYNKEFLESEVIVNSPIHVVHAGIRRSKFSTNSDNIPRRILTTARFVEKKGLICGLRALGKVKENFPEFEYHLIGSGQRQQMIEREIDRLDLNSQVNILGHVTDRELVEELKEASIFLLPCIVAQNGDRDGIPVALMEAMAMGTVPISTPVSGIPELIEDDVSGYLANPRDPEAIADKITRVFNTDNLQCMRENAKEKVHSGFTTEVVVDDLVDSFGKLISKI